MQYVAAFESLGYRLDNQRLDWSAEKHYGICVTIWKKEATWTPPPPYLDLFEMYPNGGEWRRLSGHPKRTRHLARAEDEFSGWLDVILVSGEPGQGYGDAEVWEPARRNGHRWRIVRLDRLTGLFRVQAAPTDQGKK